MVNVIRFEEFNQYYIKTRGAIRSRIPEFNVYRHADIGDQVVQREGPFTLSYYHFVLGVSLNVDISISGRRHMTEDYTLVLLLPGQIVTWERTGGWDGYIIDVKEQFLNFFGLVSTIREAKFLQDLSPIVIHLSREQYLDLSNIYEMLLAEHEHLKEENIHAIKHLMQVLVLHFSRIVRNASGQPEVASESPKQSRQTADLANQFKRLVVNNYLISKSVGFYADQLHVTPAYLSKCVRATFYKSPKEVINEVILVHAKALLQDPKRSIKEIAYDLNFVDYSHFVKFFKQAEGLTPHEYRQVV